MRLAVRKPGALPAASRWRLRLRAPRDLRTQDAGRPADRAVLLPDGSGTFSLLPDCLASRFPGALDDLERVVSTVETARSIEAAADVLRPDIVLPSAVRWVRRRLTLVRATLLAVVTLLPEVCGSDARLGAVRAALGADHALVTLRGHAAALLPALRRPLGFAPPHRPPGTTRRRAQHDLGADRTGAPG
jgi:hypothetical protein